MHIRLPNFKIEDLEGILGVQINKKTKKIIFNKESYKELLKSYPEIIIDTIIIDRKEYEIIKKK